MRIAQRISLACGLVYFLAPIGSVAQEGANDAVADFYKSRQVTIVVGYGPGGSASFYAQALAHHMGRFLPGRPAMVVLHMPGAGGLLAANNLYNSAARDGTVFAITGRTVGIEPLL